MVTEPRRERVAASVIAKEANFGLATWHQTVFMVCGGVVRAEQVRLMSATCQSLLEASRGPVTFLAVVERSSPPPLDLVRHEMAKWCRDVVPKLTIAVIVAEGGGFRSAIVRGVMVFLTTLMTQKVSFTFPTSVAGAVDILERYLPTASGGGTELSAEIARVRSL